MKACSFPLDSALFSLVVGVLLLAGCETTNEAVSTEAPLHLLLEEDFTDNGNNWFTGTIPGAYHFEVVEGEYYLRSLSDSGLVASKVVPIPEGGNFDLQVALNLYRTEKDLGYGFCWGGRDQDNRFCFYISQDQQFTLFKREGGQIHDYIPWNGDSHLQSKKNTLQIRKRAHSLKFFINGTEIGAIPYEAFYGQKIYFAADGNQDFGVESMHILVE
jgi:hypothetical protein